MPVNRAYITPFAADPDNASLYQALTALANFSDVLERAAGVNTGTQAAAVAPPATAAWTIAASGNGHFLIQITNPSAAGGGSQPAVQHQVDSATSQSFDANSATTSFVLGLAQTTLDVVDPHVTKFFRLRSRFQGSGWNSFLTYTTAAGVVGLASGALTV